MTTIEERFAHVPQDLRDRAVEGFVTRNPHMRGIDFHTMVELILDADAHLPLIGDVLVEGETATALCQVLASFCTVPNEGWVVYGCRECGNSYSILADEDPTCPYCNGTDHERLEG